MTDEPLSNSAIMAYQ